MPYRSTFVVVPNRSSFHSLSTKLLQDVIGVSHVHGPNDLMRKGRIIERNVLMNAIDAHLADRIIAHKNKCVVFNE